MKTLLAVVALALSALFVRAEDAPKAFELQGKIGCGHCMYHSGSSCSVGLKTEDGKVYLLEKADKKLMEARMNGGELKVTGTVTEKDGTLYVNASKTELVK
jgi:hypothetical protein